MGPHIPSATYHQSSFDRSFSDIPMTSQQDTSHRSVAITGASSGIGEACALEMDRLGWRVFAGVRNDEAAQKLRSRASERLLPVKMDVTQPATLAEAAKTIEAALDEGTGLGGLVNNAGIVVPGPLELVPLERLRQQMEVNVIGQVAATQAFLPLLRAGCKAGLPGGRIVNMGSVSGLLSVPFIGPYAASKYALEAITDALRLELRRWRIAVSIIEPGNIQTPIWDKTKQAADANFGPLQAKIEELYREDTEAFRAVTRHEARNAVPVETVVRAVVHALTARRPKTRYPLGARTKWTVFGRKVLRDRTMDRIVCKVMGLRYRG
jgi:NAD(P)-dependent dehydrogenase (short-subunit alcohol dehydrogenase family)